jgi:hypothetical protein
MHTPPSEYALFLAQSFNDMDSLPAYEDMCRRFSRELLERFYAKVMSIPEDQIKKTRGALFTYLVNNHARYGNRYPRH